MLEIIDINKHYGSLHVLKDVNLTIGEKEIVTILGPSGAGKTTLLQIAGTLDTPDSGRILYDGEAVQGLSDKKLSAFRNSHIGFIFQFHQLLSEFSARENVALPAMIGGMSRAKALRRADELLDLLGLADRRQHKPAQLSGGERQRTAVARALVNNPRVVFADEPTGSLDSRNRDEIQELFSSLCDSLGQTFVIVTHDPSLSGIADRTIHMADGQIVTECRKLSDSSDNSDSSDTLPLD
jgi:lipoprotein-releasing system ATP-binding protein